MSVHATISSINTVCETTWRDKIFLTFDLDWAHDDIINDTINLVETSDVPATWFVTHKSSILDRLRENPKFELGIHPNFNPLLNAYSKPKRNAKCIIDEILNIVPEAKSVRSHSMMQSSVLLEMFSKVGLTHDANHFIPASIGYDLKPWKLWNGITRIPYFWEDDIFCMYKKTNQEPDILEAVYNGEGLKVFDMHPIHIFLNTEEIERYERSRPIHQKPIELITERFEGYGTRNRLIDLLSIMNKKKIKRYVKCIKN